MGSIAIDQALRVVARHRGDAVVVAAMSAARVWPTISDDPLDLPWVGSMAKAASVGLGIALAKPDKKVIVFDADGSLLMNLGCLVTIANAKPSNLYHFVLENGIYKTSGEQPIPGQGVVKFTDFARGAGYPSAFDFDDLEDFATSLGGLMAKKGPVLICLKIAPDSPLPDFPARNTKVAFSEVKAALARSG